MMRTGRALAPARNGAASGVSLQPPSSSACSLGRPARGHGGRSGDRGRQHRAGRGGRTPGAVSTAQCGAVPHPRPRLLRTCQVLQAGIGDVRRRAQRQRRERANAPNCREQVVRGQRVSRAIQGPQPPGGAQGREESRPGLVRTSALPPPRPQPSAARCSRARRGLCARTPMRAASSQIGPGAAAPSATSPAARPGPDRAPQTPGGAPACGDRRDLGEVHARTPPRPCFGELFWAARARGSDDPAGRKAAEWYLRRNAGTARAAA